MVMVITDEPPYISVHVRHRYWTEFVLVNEEFGMGDFPQDVLVMAALDPSIASSLVDRAEGLNAAPGHVLRHGRQTASQTACSIDANDKE
jgi:hypothetical protein